MKQNNDSLDELSKPLTVDMFVEAFEILKRLDNVFNPKKSMYYNKKDQLEAKAKQQIYSNIYAKKR